MTTFKSPPPVEELGDLAWKRVELGLVAKLEANEPGHHSEPRILAKRPWLAGGIVLACVAAAALLLLSSRNGGPANPQELVHAQISELATQESSTHLKLIGVNVEVAAHSAISVEQGDDRLRIDLGSGSVRLKVAKRSNMREPVAVVAADVRVEVMGTEFAVYRHRDNVKVEVFEGVVRVTSQGVRTLVGAGESWPAALDANAALTGAAVVEDATLHDTNVAQGPASGTKHPTKQSTIRASKSASALFAEAQALEVADANRAIKLYREVAKGQGVWAANALFAEARLELARGQGQRAPHLLKRYAVKFPNGANIADVIALLEN